LTTQYKLKPSGKKACPYPTPSFLPDFTTETAVDVPVAMTVDVSPSAAAVASTSSPTVVENVDPIPDEVVPEDVTADASALTLAADDTLVETVATDDPVIADDATVEAVVAEDAAVTLVADDAAIPADAGDAVVAEDAAVTLVADDAVIPADAVVEDVAADAVVAEDAAVTLVADDAAIPADAVVEDVAADAVATSTPAPVPADDCAFAADAAPADTTPATTTSEPIALVSSDADVVPVAEDLAAVTETPAVTDASALPPAEIVPADPVAVADNSIETPSETPSVATTADPVINTLDDGTVTVSAMDSGNMFASSGTSASIPFDDTANPVVAPASIDGSATRDITGAAPMVGTDDSIALTGNGSTGDNSPAAVSLFPAPAVSNSADSMAVDSSMGISTIDPSSTSLVDPNVTAVDPMTGATDESMLAVI
jgi:hypothetical protein